MPGILKMPDIYKIKSINIPIFAKILSSLALIDIMKAATVSELKKELQTRNPKELIALCLRLSKFKKENKELLTYLLYESHNEAAYIESVKAEIDQQFEALNTSRIYFTKKGTRKILRHIKKYCRYSKKKATEVELLLYFCEKFKTLSKSIQRNTVMRNIYDRQIVLIKKAIGTLHEDLQYDYGLELEELE